MNKIYTLSPNEMMEYTRIYMEESSKEADKYLGVIKKFHNLDDDTIIKVNPCAVCHSQICNEKKI